MFSSLPSLRQLGLLGLLILPKTAKSFSPVLSIRHHHGIVQSTLILRAEASGVSAPAPVLDGKRVLPYKIMKAGLRGHTVAAVYTILSNEYKKGSDGWEAGVFVGVTMDLDQSLQERAETLGSEKMAHIRALSFAIPSKNAMDDWAETWRDLVTGAGGNTLRPEDFLLLEDDDDDDDDWDPEMIASASAAVGGSSNQIVSPFDPSNLDEQSKIESDEELALTLENVDQVLNEVRPYLISDGGNVAVTQVDADKGAVYLKLEGACGSCASSTITMSMGIERVLKENFSTFKEVIEVQDPEQAGPTELTIEDVQEEFGRLHPAIIAMGGVSEILSVDAATGVVNMVFRGSNKVRQGVELAILDLPLFNRVEFTMGDE